MSSRWALFSPVHQFAFTCISDSLLILTSYVGYSFVWIQFHIDYPYWMFNLPGSDMDCWLKVTGDYSLFIYMRMLRCFTFFLFIFQAKTCFTYLYSTVFRIQRYRSQIVNSGHLNEGYCHSLVISSLCTLWHWWPTAVIFLIVQLQRKIPENFVNQPMRLVSLQYILFIICKYSNSNKTSKKNNWVFPNL